METPATDRNIPKVISDTDLKVFPNPFLNQTTIQLALSKDEQVTLILFDQLGREIQQLVPKQSLQNGLYTYKIDGNLLDSGLYFLQLRTSTEQFMKKIIKARQ